MLPCKATELKQNCGVRLGRIGGSVIISSFTGLVVATTEPVLFQKKLASLKYVLNDKLNVQEEVGRSVA